MRPIDLFRVVAARFLSRVGSEAAFFVGVWGKAAYVLDATPGDLAWVMLALSVPLLLGSAVSGVLIDRHGPRVVLGVAEVIFVPAALAFIWADSLVALMAVSAVWAFVGAPVMTAGGSFAPYLTDDPVELKRVNSLIEAGGSAAFVLGPALGAVIVRYAHVDWVFIIDAVTSLLAAVIVWRARLSSRPAAVRAAEAAALGSDSPATPDTRASRTTRNPLREFAEGMRLAYGLRPLRYYVLAGTVVWLSFGAFGVLEPLFFRDIVLADIEMLGWVNTMFGFGMLLGAVLLGRLGPRVISARGLAVFVSLNGLGAVLYVGTPRLPVIFLGALLWGLVIGALEPLLRTLIHRDAPHDAVGRVVSTAEVHRRGGELLPLAIAPAVAALIGLQATMIGGALIASVIALLSLREAGAIDRALGVRPLPPDGIAPLTPAEEPVSPLP